MDIQDVLREMRDFAESESGVALDSDLVEWADAIEAAMREIDDEAEEYAEQVERLTEENAKLKAEIHPDWDKLEDTREAMREQSAEIERLREAVTRLLACPAIADVNHGDPDWGCGETQEAEMFARAALAGKEDV